MTGFPSPRFSSLETPSPYDPVMPLAELGDVTLHYRDHGAGPPVLGIMGFGLDQRFWGAQIPAVMKTHRFITYDNRGVGRSTGSVAATIDELAHDAPRLLDHLRIERTVVLGASMGGAIAQRLALDHPERVSAAILAVTWARPLEFTRRQHALAASILKSEGADGLAEASLLWMFTPGFFEKGHEAIDSFVAAQSAEDEARNPEALLAQLDAIEAHDVLGELPRLTCPTLVIGGKMDMLAPAFASEEIAAAIPGAELELLETGHGLLLEEMDRVNARIHAFLTKLRGGS